MRVRLPPLAKNKTLIFSRIIIRIFALVFIALGCSCYSTRETLYERSFYVMGSRVNLKLYASSEQLFHRVVQACLERTKEIDRLFSNYREDSVLAQVNRNVGVGPVLVPREFLRLTLASVDYSKFTNGAFDITIGELFKLWKGKTKSGRIPEEKEVLQALRCTGFEKIKIDTQKLQIFLDSDCVSLDFGAIGKGYAVDQMVRIARGNGIMRGTINFGGNIYAMGSPDNSEFWEIGVKKPGSDSTIITKLYLKEKGVATSGDYERYFEHKGKKYSHIIEPRTGRPLTDSLTVVAVSGTATEADVFSTAVAVLGANGAQRFVKHDQSQGFIIISKDGKKKSCFGSHVCSQE